MSGIDFRKTITDGNDTLLVRSHRDSDWVTLEVVMPVGDVSIDLRSEEMVSDLHYALGRYLTLKERSAP